MIRTSLFALTAAIAVTVPAPGSAQETAANPYETFGCAACHGAQGEGTPAGPDIVVDLLSEPSFAAYVREPNGTMPAYVERIVSDEQLARIHEFLASLTPARKPEGRVDVGRVLYASYGCYSCHSNEAQGVLHGPRIGPDPISWGRFDWYVRNPTAQMPPYSDAVLSPQEMADIYAFLEALPQPKPLSEIPLLNDL